MKNINTTVLNPNWVVGFIDGEGTFFVDLLKNSTMSLGIQVQLRFVITQHIRDLEVMNKFPVFFGAGNIVSDGPTKVQFRMRGFNDLEQRLFPLLDECPLVTQKRLDAEAFRYVHTLMKAKQHLTSSGLEEIRAIKGTMNRARMDIYKSPSNCVNAYYDIVQSSPKGVV